MDEGSGLLKANLTASPRPIFKYETDNSFPDANYWSSFSDRLYEKPVPEY